MRPLRPVVIAIAVVLCAAAAAVVLKVSGGSADRTNANSQNAAAAETAAADRTPTRARPREAKPAATGAATKTAAPPGSSAAGAGPAGAAGAAPEPGKRICEKFGSVRIAGGRYVAQNNNWGDSIQQCITVTSAGFRVTSGKHNKATNGPPGGYPSVFLGCHYKNCTAGSGLPAAIAKISDVTSQVRATVAGGQWNAAYDLWYDPTPRTDGQNTGAELMIWLNHRGAPQPIGSPVGTARIAGTTWEVWKGNVGWNVISYVRRQPTTSFSGSLKPFERDAQSRGQIDPAWFLTSVQFGFEPWEGGPGLAVNSFAAAVTKR